MKITLLNTAILTAFGTFDFQPVSLAEAREMVKNSAADSAIGHAETAAVLSDLLEIEVETNRVEYTQKVNETALVFRLRSRIPAGKILDRAEIETIGYEFGILRKLK